MYAALYVDGIPAELTDDVPGTVSLELESGGGPSYRCRACGEDLVETIDGYQTGLGESTCDFGDGPHDPERVPLAWCNSAAVHADECEDSVTVSISVGDPRGAFTFTIRRVPDDADSDLAGRLLMHVPHPAQSSGHMPLTRLHDGTFAVGSH